MMRDLSNKIMLLDSNAKYSIPTVTTKSVNCKTRTTKRKPNKPKSPKKRVKKISKKAGICVKSKNRSRTSKKTKVEAF